MNKTNFVSSQSAHKRLAKRKRKFIAKPTKLQRSQKAHLALRDKYFNASTTPKNLCYGNYHSDCLEYQSKHGKMLTKQEKRSLFQWWHNYEIKGKATKYPLK